MNIKINRVKDKDWSAIRALRLEMISNSPKYFNVNHDIWNNQKDDFWQNFTNVCSVSSHKSIFIVKVEEDIIAMSHVEIIDRRANFGMLYVKEEYRNIGIAEALVLVREKWAKKNGADIAFCLITDGNAPSEKLHFKLGWKPAGIKVKENSIIENEWTKEL